MTNFHVMTLFPDMILQGVHTSILGKAEEKGIISVQAWNIRDYTQDKHKKVDDYPYGGGAGMLMQAQPVYDTYRAVMENIHQRDCIQLDDSIQLSGSIQKNARVLFMSPQGKQFDQNMARELAEYENLVFLCGHYEGIDERVLQEIVTDEVSIGDYVLTGGELPAMVIIDAVARMVPGVLTNSESGIQESFYDNLLEYPQYSRPETWNERKVPEILLSGDHAKVDAWRLEQAKERTREKRPDLYEKYLAEHPPQPERKKRKRKRKSLPNEEQCDRI